MSAASHDTLLFIRFSQHAARLGFDYHGERRTQARALAFVVRILRACGGLGVVSETSAIGVVVETYISLQATCSFIFIVFRHPFRGSLYGSLLVELFLLCETARINLVDLEACCENAPFLR